MATSTLWGPVLNTHDLAKLLIEEELNTPYISFKRNFATNRDVSVRFFQHGEQISLSQSCGLYIIFRRILNSLEILYVGYTDSNFRERIYRYVKELEGRSRPDESHAGAIIARDVYGVKSTDNHYMKIVPYRNIINLCRRHNCFLPSDITRIDEHVAYELNAPCNAKRMSNNRAQSCQNILELI